MNPAAESELGVMLDMAYSLGLPCAVRYPRGSGARRAELEDIPVVYGRNSVVRRGDGKVVLWALGPEIDTALEVADILGTNAAVILVRFISPFDRELALQFAPSRHFTIENHCIRGGLFTTLCETLAEVSHGEITPFGWPADRTVCHGKVHELRKKYGMDAESIAAKIKESLKIPPGFVINFNPSGVSKGETEKSCRH